MLNDGTSFVIPASLIEPGGLSPSGKELYKLVDQFSREATESLKFIAKALQGGNIDDILRNLSINISWDEVTGKPTLFKPLNHAHSTGQITGLSAMLAGKAPLLHTHTTLPLSGTGSPEGVVTAAVGSLYTRADGGAGTALYVKESGTGNTGWIAK